jgi:hypothetical protein
MSSRGGRGAGRGRGAAKRGGDRYFAGKVADSPKESKVTAVAAADSNKGQKRKGGPEHSAPKQSQKPVATLPQKKKGKRPKAERNGRKPWEIEEKVAEKEPEIEDVDSDDEDESAESEASMPSDSEDSDFEQVVAKEGGSARYKAALALRTTFEVSPSLFDRLIAPISSNPQILTIHLDFWAIC